MFVGHPLDTIKVRRRGAPGHEGGSRCSVRSGAAGSGLQFPAGTARIPVGVYGRTTAPGRHCTGGGASAMRRGEAGLGVCSAVGRPLAARRPGVSQSRFIVKNRD